MLKMHPEDPRHEPALLEIAMHRCTGDGIGLETFVVRMHGIRDQQANTNTARFQQSSWLNAPAGAPFLLALFRTTAEGIQDWVPGTSTFT